MAFPDFPHERELDHDDVDQATLAAIDDKDLRLHDVVRQLDEAEYRAGRPREAGKLRASRLLDELGVRRARMGQRGSFERGLPRAHAGRLCDLHVNLWRRLGELVTPDAEREQASHQLAGALADTAAACRNVADQWSAGAGIREAAAGSNGTGPGRGQPVPSG